MINSIKIKKNGFTIIETIIATAVLVLVIAGATTAIQTGISSYIFSKDQVIAFYLAQEGFEQIRNLRDQNNLDNPIEPWLRGVAEVGNPCFNNSPCGVNLAALPPNPGLFACTGSSPNFCPIMTQNTTTGFYGYGSGSGWINTVFRREIRIATVNATEVAVTVTVNWSKGATNRQFIAKTNLLNWQ